MGFAGRATSGTCSCGAELRSDRRLGSHPRRLHRRQQACQVFAGNRVHIVERALALNLHPRRHRAVSFCLSSNLRVSFAFASSLTCVTVACIAAITTRKLSGGPQVGQATPLRSVPCGAYGLDRTAAPPMFGNYVMASRLTVALMRDAPIHPRR